MSRPVNADADATRRRMLDAAFALFAEGGASGTSLREVATRAGVSLAMVHHYFGNKDGLYRACIASMYDELEALSDALAPALTSDGGLETRLDEAVRAAFRFACGHRAALRLLLRSVTDRGEIDAGWREAKHLPFLGFAARSLAQVLEGVPELALRLEVQSLVHLGVRYALTAPSELVLVTGLGADERSAASARRQQAALRAVEDHLVDLARSRFLGAHGLVTHGTSATPPAPVTVPSRRASA